jgi:hypothetical protein
VKTPQHQFSTLSKETNEIILRIAAKHGVSPDDLFADQAKRAASDLARKDAARELFAGGMTVANIADLFGVSRVAINNAVRVK